MRRLFGPVALEVALPILAALVVGLVLFVALVPRAVGQSSEASRVRIYVSVPLYNDEYASIVHGAQMAVDDAGAKAGSFNVELVPLSDSDPATTAHNWGAATELANARQAVQDPDAMAYIGTYNSGAAKISIPVLNRVNMAMISPGNTYPGLTKPGTGDAGEPYNYYPVGARNYFRVVPADDLQGPAAVAYAQTLGVKSIYVLDDTELYGHGIARIVASTAISSGMQVLGGPEGIDVHVDDYTALAAKIVATKPDMVYFGGISGNHPGLVLNALRGAGFTGIFMGADAIAGDSVVATQSQPNGTGDVYATQFGLPGSQLTGDGATWYSRYKARFPNDQNQDLAPFGYEAARVALHAIEVANKKDRDAIRQAVATTKASDLPAPHIFGDWTFDANGDTSFVSYSVEKSVGQGSSSTWQYLGQMLQDSNTKAWQFQPAGQ